MLIQTGLKAKRQYTIKGLQQATNQTSFYKLWLHFPNVRIIYFYCRKIMIIIPKWMYAAKVHNNNNSNKTCSYIEMRKTYIGVMGQTKRLDDQAKTKLSLSLSLRKKSP